jgi:hypothetical protein
MINKRGFEMIWSTRVMMILAFIVLIFLILFFTNSSTGFLDSVKSYFSNNNVDAVLKSCNLLVSSGQEYNFCCDKKEVKYMLNGKKSIGSFSCGELVNQSFAFNKISGNIKCEDVNC